MTTNIQRISDAEYSAALAAGQTEGKIEIRAQAVRYVPGVANTHRGSIHPPMVNASARRLGSTCGARIGVLKTGAVREVIEIADRS
jgi:hypothetical protein